MKYPAAAAAMLLPSVAVSIQGGETAMVFVALAVCGCSALVEWLRTASLRDLALSAILLGLAVITRWQGAMLAVAAAAVVAVGAAVRRRGWAYVEGHVITFALPGVYAAMLWVGGNWLILGSPLFFLRSLSGLGSPETSVLPGALAWDCPWILTGVLAAFACSVPLLGLALERLRTRLPQNVLACCMLVALVCVVWHVEMPTSQPPPVSDTRRVVTTLAKDLPDGTFIVTGYTGYEFVKEAGHDPDHRWVHVMDLRPEHVDKVLADYLGCQVFLLVNADEELERWHHVGLGWKGDGNRIPERYLFVRQVGPWAIFEVLRADD